MEGGTSLGDAHSQLSLALGQSQSQSINQSAAAAIVVVVVRPQLGALALLFCVQRKIRGNPTKKGKRENQTVNLFFVKRKAPRETKKRAENDAARRARTVLPETDWVSLLRLAVLWAEFCVYARQFCRHDVRRTFCTRCTTTSAFKTSHGLQLGDYYRNHTTPQHNGKHQEAPQDNDKLPLLLLVSLLTMTTATTTASSSLSIDLESAPVPGQLGSAVLDTEGRLVRQGGVFDETNALLLYRMLLEAAVLPETGLERLVVTLQSDRYLVTRDSSFVYMLRTKAAV